MIYRVLREKQSAQGSWRLPTVLRVECSVLGKMCFILRESSGELKNKHEL